MERLARSEVLVGKLLTNDRLTLPARPYNPYFTAFLAVYKRISAA